MFGVDVTVSALSFCPQSIFSSFAKSVSHKTAGDHDIDKPLTFPTNDRIIIHDSNGFEAGEEANVQKVLDFIDCRSKMPALCDRLHAIWLGQPKLTAVSLLNFLHYIGFAPKYRLQAADYLRRAWNVF